MKHRIGLDLHYMKAINHYRHCLAYVYEPLLENSLKDFKARWNSHRIRNNRKAGCPSGVPDDLYYLPQQQGWADYLFEVCS